MDLIERIQKIFRQNGLKSPYFDLHYDEQLHVVGYIADEYFENKDDKQSQKYIWEKLRLQLGDIDLKRILTIFHETPRERAERLIAYNPENRQQSKYWFHISPDQARYWVFIDVAKVNEDIYKTFYLVLNQKDNFKQGLFFEYNSEVLSFMELEQGEIYNELYNNTFNNAESVLKAHIMQKHQALTEKGVWGSENMYDYIYKNSFKLTPVTKSQLIFTEEEIPRIKAAFKAKDLKPFELKKDIENAIKKSEIINKSRKEI